MLQPISLSNDLRRNLSEYLNPDLIKKRESGKKKNPKTGKWETNYLSYISANTCIDLLNDAFGHNWSMRIVDRWMEPGVPSPFIEKDEKKPIPQPPTAWCIVELTVPLKDENGDVYYITKSAFGSQAITGNQSVQSQNGYKGAQSDALKKAATLLGIALELYRDENEGEAFNGIFDSMVPVVWTEEVIEENKELWDQYEKIKEGFGWDDEDTGYFVTSVTNGYTNNIYKMPVKYMEELLNEMVSYTEGEEE